jgi:hypothetical protein
MYSALKALVASTLLSAVDPASGTNPLWPALSYAGWPAGWAGAAAAQLPRAPPRLAAAAAASLEAERLLEGATLDLAQALAQHRRKAGSAAGGGAPAPAARAAAARALGDALAAKGLRVVSEPVDAGEARALGRGGSGGGADPLVVVACDAVVVGSGAGGGVVAAVLAQAGLKVRGERRRLRAGAVATPPRAPASGCPPVHAVDEVGTQLAPCCRWWCWRRATGRPARRWTSGSGPRS